jgi:hypothetical protein
MNKKVILTSTLIIDIVTYLTLQISPLLEDHLSFSQNYDNNINTLRILLNLIR